MVFDVIFAPTKSFEGVFHNPNINSALIVVLTTGLFLGLATFFVTASLLPSIYMFGLNIIQWLVFAGVVWFFEFIHVRKRKRMMGTSFEQCACVVGKLWGINLIASVIIVLIAFCLNFISSVFLAVLTPFILIIGMILLVSWVVASFLMLKVVLGVSGGKLLINWVIANILNASLITLFTTIFAVLF